MKKLFAVVLVTLLTGTYCFAAQTEKQKQDNAKASASGNAKTDGAVNAGSGNVALDAGTEISAEMASTLDLKKAKPGAPFAMKTTRPVKRDGKEIISKGSTITGHVEQITRADNTTNATLVFDQLQDKKTHLTSPISAVVTTVTKASSAMPMEDMTSSARGDQQTRTQTRSSQQDGGLIGGVTQTVSGVTQTAAGATGQLGSTASSTTNGSLGANSGVAGTAGGLTRGTIQILSDTTGSATSGSTLALSDKNPRIDSGTQFVLQTTSTLALSKEAKQK